MRKILISIFIFIISFTIFTGLVLILFKWIDPPTTSFIQQIRPPDINSILFKNDVKQVWMPIEKISDEVLIAILTSEDQRFVDHWGFDVKQIQKAIDDFEEGKKLRGASTITQQVAKNLFLFTDKSFFRKVLEAYFTVMIELTWSKKRIFEVYLNIAEFGDGIYGVEAASSHHFNKSSAYLNSREGAMLAAILPNPKKYRLDTPSKYLLYRINRIINEEKNLDKNKIRNEFQ